jgi:hypothetical protein
MTLTIRKALFLLVVVGACGLLGQACVHEMKASVFWEETSSKPILKSTQMSDREKDDAFRAQIKARSNGNYNTTFMGGFSSMRKCFKINPSTINQKVPCDDARQPNAIHVAQRVYFADEARKKEFMEKLELN